MSAVTGKAWTFGDEINTDVMAPGRFFKDPMDVVAKHCMEAVDPEFPVNVQPGDIVVAGRSFGVGSAREQAPLAFRTLEVGAILAESFARIFYRSTINLGVVALVFPQAKEITAGDRLTVDAFAGNVVNETSGKIYEVDPIPQNLIEMIQAGGLMPHLKARLQKEGKIT